jgi:alpha-L-fucosidase
VLYGEYSEVNVNIQPMKKLLLLVILFASICSGQAQNEKGYYVKHLEFPQNATLQEKVDMAARLVPTPQQLAWQQMELTAFLHFGINTFTGREWGDGTEDPALFNPSQLDAEQWVRTLKDAGFKMVLLTAKHHDGFCLWPTKTTTHSVASSSWKNGKGDVVKELRDACDKYGMKFGVYLSPWDRNASCYGDSPKYNQFFIQQLTELLTNYGEVHEVWFDGANGEGPNGKKQVYDWDAFYKTIQKLQPKAVMAIMGDDVRWVGNEKGIGRETEWNATVLTPGIYARSEENNKRLGVFSKAEDLGSRDILKNATELFWYPSEVDVSIRPGWFYHKEEDNKVKSLKHLADIYFQSVGYNSVLLLNIPPDRRGLINEADVTRLKEFAEYRKQAFADDRVKEGQKLWEAISNGERTYKLKSGSEINVVMLQEDIARGQRVEAFSVEAQTADGWKEIAQGTTVGYKRLLRFPDVKANQLRIKIKSCRLTANISRVAAFYVAPLQEESEEVDWNNLPRTTWKQVSDSPLTIDLGKSVILSAFTYAPAKAEAKPTMAFKYKFFVSTDGNNWQEVPVNGEFSNIMHNPLPQTVPFKEKVKARFIRLVATTPTDTPAKVEMNEIGVTTEK